jgi:tRNA U38,U39,U40 pseudouridine synthase TruA
MFDYNYCWPFEQQLDVARMQAAAVHFLGTHDFSTFRAAGASLAHV